VPELTWQKAPRDGGLLVDIPGHEAVPITLIAQSGIQRVYSTDGTGLAGGIDVPAGQYALSVDGPGLDSAPVYVDVEVGRITAVRYATSRSVVE
jgi:hypothetical protein